MNTNLRQVLARFLLDKQCVPEAIWWVIGVSVVLGALYGIFITPFWAEAVEFAQCWAGLVSYEHSPWGPVIFSAPSLQITIPALLLLAGVKVWPLSLACTAFFCAVSFSAVAAAGFSFTRNVALSVALPLLLLTFNFSNAHGYPVIYPVHTFQFGQTGMYITVLALSLAACGWPLAAGVIGGLLGGIHTVWLPCFVMGAFSAALWLDRTSIKRLFLGTAFSAVLSAGFLYYGDSHVLLPHPAYQPPVIPSQLSTAVAPVDSFSGRPTEEAKPGKKIRGTFSGHNVLFADARSPLKTGLEFFLPEAVFILLALSLHHTQRAYRFTPEEFSYGRRLIITVAIPVSITALFKLYEETDPYFTLLGLINDRLPGLILRAIINRWLNLTNVLIPIMLMALMAMQVKGGRSWSAAVMFLIVATFEAFGRKPTWYIGAFLIVALLVYYLRKDKKTGNDSPQDQSQGLVITGLILCFIITKIMFLACKAYEDKRYTGSDAIDPLTQVAQEDKGTLIIAPYVSTIRNFSPQLRTGRATIVPDRMDVYDKATSSIIHVYCYTDASISFDQFYASVKPCFENRPAREWAVIAGEAHATGMITPDDWKLQISPVISAGGFSYYRF